MVLLLGALLWTPPLLRTDRCAKKRVDACGCHHVFGVRHCHPSRRTTHCEAMAGTLSLPYSEKKRGSRAATNWLMTFASAAERPVNCVPIPGK